MNTDGQSELFYNEVSRIPLGESDITFSQTAGLDDCIFSISLPTPNEGDLSEIIVGEESNGTAITVSIAMYYPATFVQQSVSCQTLTLTESNTEKVDCVATYSEALTPNPTTEVFNASVVDADIYDWGSDTLPVYVDDFPEGAFEDLGFAQGWNLAQFVQGEMVLVEPLDGLDQLSQVVLDNNAFLPRYQVSGLGSISAEADFGDQFSIDLLSTLAC